jgi:hypothetical protein
VKAFAAKLKKIAFKDIPRKTSVSMLDLHDNGSYSATFSQTSVPDGHKLYVTAVGSTEDGVLFRREHAIALLVSAKPDPKFTLLDIDYAVDGESIHALLRVTPRDRFGNLMLADPAKPNDVVLKVQNAETQSLQTTFDGSYTSSLFYGIGQRPTISFFIGGDVVFRDRPLPAIDKLTYVDQLIDFEEGLEAAKGANRHDDGKAALDGIMRKPADRFVSLGGYGVLTLAVSDNAVVAQGDDDITVFVHADSDPRSYLVEAQDAGGSSGWVQLGRSSGGTQSFSLRAAHLSAAAAIRITDTSGRIRDAAMKPLTTPGVSIRAVGAAEVKPFSARPRFENSPNQFSPKIGSAETIVSLFGSNFGIGTLSVLFGDAPAKIVGTPTITQIVVHVPSLPRGRVKITVRNADGTAVSTDSFTVV